MGCGGSKEKNAAKSTIKSQTSLPKASKAAGQKPGGHHAPFTDTKAHPTKPDHHMYNGKGTNHDGQSSKTSNSLPTAVVVQPSAKSPTPTDNVQKVDSNGKIPAKKQVTKNPDLPPTVPAYGQQYPQQPAMFAPQPMPPGQVLPPRPPLTQGQVPPPGQGYYMPPPPPPGYYGYYYVPPPPEPGHFDAGARFDSTTPPRVPPPPPGVAPNAAQIAAAQGKTVKVPHKPHRFLEGGSDGGYTFW